MLKCSNSGEFLADPGAGRRATGPGCGAAGGHLAVGRRSTPEIARRSPLPRHGTASALKFNTWEMQGSQEPAAPPAPLLPDVGTQKSLCLSPRPTPQRCRRALCHPGSPHKRILVIQMRSCHKGEGPALNKEPLGTAAEGDGRGGRGSVVSTDECKCLHPLGATSLGTTETGFVSGRHRSYARPQECPANPSWRNAWGARTDLPHHP